VIFFRDEEIAVLGLNTARRLTHKSGRLSLEQISQIRRTFSDVPREVFKVLATHHPLGFPGMSGRWSWPAGLGAPSKRSPRWAFTC
jgi:hypothetical protein